MRGAELLGQLGQATTVKAVARTDMRLLRTCLARLSRSRPTPSDARCGLIPASILQVATEAATKTCWAHNYYQSGCNDASREAVHLPFSVHSGDMPSSLP